MTDRTIQEWMDAPSIEIGQELEEKAIVGDISGTIDLGEYTIALLIQDMGPYLSLDDLISVSRVILLFRRVLERIEVQTSRQDTHLIVGYLCDRLSNKDENPTNHAGLGDIALSLSALSTWEKFMPSDAALIADSVFTLARSEETFRKQSNLTRKRVYELISKMAAHDFQGSIQKNMGFPKFITGLVDMAELEKDPSCLKVLFQLYAFLGKSWTLDKAEYNKLWELFIRYFPITVGRKTPDPTVPTPEELRMLLLECFISNDGYAEEGFPYFLGHLDTDQTADKKKELLETIEACIKSYSMPILLQWSSKLWDSLKFEVWNGENEDFINTTIAVIESIVKSMTSKMALLGSTLFEDDVRKFIVSITDECIQRIHDSKQYLVSSGRILKAIGSTTAFAFDFMVRSSVPKLFVLSQTLELISEKKALLAVFNRILEAGREIVNHDPGIIVSTDNVGISDGTNDLEYTTATQPLRIFRDKLTDLYFGAMSEVTVDLGSDASFAGAAIEGLLLLHYLPGFLSAVERGMILGSLNGLIFNSKDAPEIHDAALLAVSEITTIDHNGFINVTLPEFIKRLPQSLPNDRAQRTAELENAISVLQDLVQVSCTQHGADLTRGNIILPGKISPRQSFDASQLALQNHWETVIKHGGQSKYAELLLAAMFTGLKLYESAEAKNRSSATYRVIPGIPNGQYGYLIIPLFDQVVVERVDKNSALSLGLAKVADETLGDTSIEILGKMATLALRVDEENRMKPEDPYENNVASNDYLFGRNKETGWFSSVWNLSPGARKETDFLPSHVDLQNGPADKCLVNYLAMSLLAGIKPKKGQDILDFHVGKAATAMIQNATSAQSQVTKLGRMSMLWFLQLLINKFGSLEKRWVGLVKDESPLIVMQGLVDNFSSKNDQEIQNIYQTLAYFTAACYAVLSPEIPSMIHRMIEGVKIPQHGITVAQSFRVLLAPSEIMNKENFCTMRPLRKARLLADTAQPLITIWRTTGSSKEIKGNCLVALAGVLAYQEPNVLKDNVDLLFPMILEGTNVQNDEWSKAAFIEALVKLVPLCPHVIESYLDSVISRMTDRTHNTYNSPSDSSVRCRWMALDVLGSLVKFVNPTLLLPRRFKVICELDIALDDCSREVRHHAGQCKMAWYNLEK